MASANPSEINIQDLPYEVKEMILKDLSDDDLIKQTQIPGLRHVAIDLLKRRLDNLSIRNLVRLYRVPESRIAVGQYYAQCLLLLKYKRIKEIYQNEIDPIVRNAIEARTADIFTLLDHPMSDNFNVIQKIDIMRANLFTNKFIEIVEENGGPFNGIAIMSGPEQRHMTSGVINMIRLDPNGVELHSYSLEISVGYSQDMCILLRGHTVEGYINCEYNDIFQRLLESIELNYTLTNINIYTRLIGNNTMGPRIEVYSV